MTKYDFKVDLSLNSSTGIILSQIKPNSLVLEFGCAMGRMTHYMKETLDCKVYIVEYDKEAFDIAKKYAVDGICDDIMSYSWAVRYSNLRFDAIVFADVLEHLPDPEGVLSRASDLLADTGKIFISVPNVTHNDILCKAYNDRFDYTATGILDETHIHFWGKKNIETLVRNSGLSLREFGATYCETGRTEQGNIPQLEKKLMFQNALKERVCGEIYQFVLTLDKAHENSGQYKLRQPSLQSHIYFDRGNGITPQDVLPVKAVFSNDGSYHVHFELKNPNDIRGLRFDPIEHQGCILRNIKVSQGANKINLSYLDSYQLENCVLFLGDDPMVFADQFTGEEPIVIDANFLLVGEQYLHLLLEEFVWMHDAKKRIEDDFFAEKEKHSLRLKNIEEKLSDTEKLCETIEKRKKTEIDCLNKELMESRLNENSFSILVNKKEVCLVQAEANIAYLRESLRRAEEALVAERKKSNELQQHVSRNIFIDLEPLRKVYRFVKRCVKKMLSPGLRSFGVLKASIKKLIGKKTD